MAQRRVTVFVDDLTGKELAPDQAETIKFSLDGVEYELDTDIKAAERIRKALSRYVTAGRRVQSRGARSRPTSRQRVAPDPRAVRAWAAANKIQLSNRGRIPAAVVAQFHAAGN
jgi:hypothetical protein